jgi:tetratricopeptide (TPR) repeat protein
MVVCLVALLTACSTASAENEQRRAKQQMKFGFQAAKRGYWLEALDRFERADKLTPNQPRILNNIAVALEASGRYEEALIAYETALAAASNDRVIRKNLNQFREFYESYIAIPEPEPEGDEAARDGGDSESEGEREEEEGEGGQDDE